METNYTIIGQDGEKYGPIDLATLKQWIAEGRLSSATQVMRSDSSTWLPASQFPELGLGVPPLSGAAPTPLPQAGPRALSMEDSVMISRIRVGASWFYWIVGLAIVNYVLIATNANLLLAFGPGLPLLAPGNLLLLGTTGIYAIFGYFGGKGKSWAFVVGMLLYALDAMVFVLAKDWLSLAFHGYVLYRLFMGAKSCFELRAKRSH